MLGTAPTDVVDQAERPVLIEKALSQMRIRPLAQVQLAVMLGRERMIPNRTTAECGRHGAADR